MVKKREGGVLSRKGLTPGSGLSNPAQVEAPANAG